MGFEHSRINELAKMFPDLKDEALDILTVSVMALFNRFLDISIITYYLGKCKQNVKKI